MERDDVAVLCEGCVHFMDGCCDYSMQYAYDKEDKHCGNPARVEYCLSYDEA